MPRFCLKKILTCLIFTVFNLFFILNASASSINIAPVENIKAFFLTDSLTLRQGQDNFQSAAFNQIEYSLENGYTRLASLNITAYRLMGKEKGRKVVDFEKFINVKVADKNTGNFLMLETERVDSDYRMDRNFLKKKDRYDHISEQTNYMVFMHIAAAGILYLMPESVTKWEKSAMTFSEVTEKWGRDVKAGPVWDKDDWVINYIGHPYQGAAYYVLARHSGFGWKGAFLYTTMLSTFMWEYGFESFGEIPSVQDLIVTPIIGSMLGEVLLKGEERIIENKGEVLGSRILGDISLVLIDPAGSIIKGLRRLTNVPARIRTRTEVFYEPTAMYDYRDKMDPLSEVNSYYGMRLVFTYN